MPSPFPRLTVVVTPEQHQLLTRLSALQGRSQASYVRGLLNLATPSLRSLCRALEDVEAEQAAYDHQVQADLADMLREADEELEEQLSLLDPFEVGEALDAPDGADRSEARTAPPAAAERAADPTPRKAANS